MKKSTNTNSSLTSFNTTSHRGEPETMEDLLKGTAVAAFTGFKRGMKVNAKIVKINKKEILCDIGAKSYGVVVGREFDMIADQVGTFKEGDSVEAEVIIPEMESGDTLISLRRVANTKIWTDLGALKTKGEELDVFAVKVIAGGLLVDCKGLRGFIPQLQLDPDYQHEPEKLVGQKMRVRVLEVDKQQNRLVLSHKEVTRKDEIAAKRQSLSAFKVGDAVTGTITSLEKYGVHVEIKKGKESVDGLIHISELSWQRVDDVESLYKVGDEITSKVTGFDEQEGMLNLSVKQLSDDPWNTIETKYKPEQEVTGKVVKVSNLGIFVALEAGIEGLIHISKIPAGKEYAAGDEITAVVDKIDKSGRKLSLSFILTSKPIGYR